jgi:serine kinase of HPr protein (carbohydrate metabolism regulator)
MVEEAMFSGEIHRALVSSRINRKTLTYASFDAIGINLFAWGMNSTLNTYRKQYSEYFSYSGPLFILLKNLDKLMTYKFIDCSKRKMTPVLNNRYKCIT